MMMTHVHAPKIKRAPRDFAGERHVERSSGRAHVPKGWRRWRRMVRGKMIEQVAVVGGGGAGLVSVSGIGLEGICILNDCVSFAKV